MLLGDPGKVAITYLTGKRSIWEAGQYACRDHGRSFYDMNEIT